MFDLTLVALFIPTFFFVSITPGMCMTLALTLGISIGFRRTLFMMLGELTGVALVAVIAVLGAASLILNYPSIFSVFKIIGGCYLIYVGIQTWRAKHKLSLLNNKSSQDFSKWQLASQGFVTAVANPKGWAFTASLLPPFINPELSLTPQLSLLICIVLVSEFLCMCIYAGGGSSLRHLLKNASALNILNFISGSLMVGIGLWLFFG